MFKSLISVLIVLLSTTSVAAVEITGKIEEYGIYKQLNDGEAVSAPKTVAGHSTFGEFVKIKTTDNK